MPTQVRLFWWICVFVVITGILEAAWPLLFPSAHYLASLAKLPVAFRSITYRTDIINVTISTAVWSVFILGLAWLAAFRHSNLARWGIVIVFLLRESIPLLISLSYNQTPSYGKNENWGNPIGYVVPALEIAAVVCLFWRGVGSWFESKSGRGSPA